ncbi:unnamed protein product [Owenia fusiformis]|nr:unnamed protein product [Owenia fusiformis]
MIYCRVPKIGCTLFKRIMYVINGNTISIDPYDIPPLIAKDLPIKRFENYSRQQVEYMLKHYTKVLIVRDPLDRLISGYFDKLYSINPNFWYKAGAPAINIFRKHISSWKSKQCGFDTTFEEFLLHIIHRYANRIPLNKHWRSIYDMCFPCNINYDIIGHIETYSKDISHILGTIHAEHSIKMRSNYSRLENIHREVDIMFRGYPTACGLTKKQLLNRILGGLETRGYIKLDNQERRNLLQGEIESDVLKSKLTEIYYKKPNPEKGFKDLRKTVLHKIPLEILKAIQSIYKHDLRLFGYENFV